MGLVACRKNLSTAEGTIEEFVDLRYVEMNPFKAREHCTGLALQKIDDEIRLTRGQPMDPSTRKPRVRYRALHAKKEPQSISVLYEGSIHPPEAQPFKKKWLVTARRDGNGWKISNFTDFDD
jgi:hypothetical protein